MSDERKTQIKEIGKFCPQPVPVDSLGNGEVGTSLLALEMLLI